MIISAAKGLALCRIGFGLYFISQAWDKTSKGWLASGAPLAGFLFGNPAAQPPTRGAFANSEAFYRPFLEGPVQSNPLLFAQLVTIGEWVAGLALVFGLLTRLGSIVGIWLTLNYMLMKGLPSMGGSSDRLFVLGQLAFILASAGLVWGLDGAWRRQLAGNGLTRWLAGLPPRGDVERELEPAPAGRPAVSTQQ
jgi:uncharacterized membrane protein YphA (DoxX/SURF4 family)